MGKKVIILKRLETKYARKFRRKHKSAIAKHCADGWCPSTGPYTGVPCQLKNRHAGNHRAEDTLDPVVIEEWCEPRLNERYED